MSRLLDKTSRGEVYVVAELGANHGGDVATAKRMIDACAWAGVDAVKGQKRHMPSLFTDEELARPYTGPHSYGATYGEHRAALELTMDQHTELADYATARGLDYSLSVWDTTSLYETMAARRPTSRDEWIKIPSACATWSELLAAAASYEVPIILSTGMCDQKTVDGAVMDTAGAPLCLMQCTSTYPCENADAHVRVVADYQDSYAHNEWYIGTGFSAHTRGWQPTLAAVALGAVVVEHHFTLDRCAKGSDHAASLEPDGLRRMVRDVRAVTESLGDERKRVLDCELPVMAKLRTEKMRRGTGQA